MKAMEVASEQGDSVWDQLFLDYVRAVIRVLNGGPPFSGTERALAREFEPLKGANNSRFARIFREETGQKWPR